VGRKDQAYDSENKEIRKARDKAELHLGKVFWEWRIT
jgi:hypothetical protein